MSWDNILSAVLAGGIAGQIVTLLGGDRLTRKREYRKWKLTEKHKLYSELVTIATLTPKKDEEVDNWTYMVRDISQRIHILHEGGAAPEPLYGEIETIFRMTKSYKNGGYSESWGSEMRDATRRLRAAMADDLANSK
ncbi:hypothetical protein AB4483_19265 [Vibrio splendidus]